MLLYWMAFTTQVQFRWRSRTYIGLPFYRSRTNSISSLPKLTVKRRSPSFKRPSSGSVTSLLTSVHRKHVFTRQRWPLPSDVPSSHTYLTSPCLLYGLILLPNLFVKPYSTYNVRKLLAAVFSLTEFWMFYSWCFLKALSNTH